MGGIINTIVSILIAMTISGSATSMAEVTPQEAADAFLQNLSADDAQTDMMYMDNKYINFLENVKGTDEEMDRLENAVFKNFSYEITDERAKGDVAVVKVAVKNCDFSDIMDDYEKASYKYVTEHLYSDTVTDKKKLNKKCLDIYLDQIEKSADKDPSYEADVFIPMEADGYGGWRIILNDDIMKSILGELEIPTSE